MSTRYIDLHCHTHFSDGQASPAETVALARERGLVALSITDHDSFDAIDPALEVADELELITGIELSCSHHDRDVHMLAYFVDHKYPPLAEKVRFYQDERLKRGIKIVERLNELGLDLRLDTVKRVAGDGTIGRVHVADAMVSEELVHTFDEAFSRYLGYHAPAYVPKTHFDPQEAIDLVHDAGGIAVMAHPGTVRHDNIIEELAEMGLDGVEVYHSKHTSGQVRHYKRIAEKLNLLTSGGSDWHGRNDSKAEIGSQRVPYAVLQKMKDHIATTTSRAKELK